MTKSINVAGFAATAAFAALLAGSPVVHAEPVDPSTPQTEILVPADGTSTAVATAKKLKIKGVVTRRDADTFTAR